MKPVPPPANVAVRPMERPAPARRRRGRRRACWTALRGTKRGVQRHLTAPEPAGNRAATAGDHDGTLDLSWDRVPGATGYEVYRSTYVAQPNGWAFACSCARSGATVEGLASGTRHWFRVRAVGAAGPGPWSDPATKIAP